MEFENVALELGATDIDICKADGCSLIARFYDAFDLRGVNVVVKDSRLTVYDKNGETIMEATIYKNNQKPGEE